MERKLKCGKKGKRGTRKWDGMSKVETKQDSGIRVRRKQRETRKREGKWDVERRKQSGK